MSPPSAGSPPALYCGWRRRALTRQRVPANSQQAVPAAHAKERDGMRLSMSVSLGSTNSSPGSTNYCWGCRRKTEGIFWVVLLIKITALRGL